MITPTQVLLSCASLSVTMLAAQGQSVTDSPSVSDRAMNSSAGAPVAAIASSYAFADQVPDAVNVTLEGVQTTSSLSARMVVTVHNPTSNAINASLRLVRFVEVGATLGAWGPGVSTDGIVLVPISGLQPGETRNVTWNYANAFTSTHSPTSTTDGPWEDVLADCVGSDRIEFGSTILAEFRRVLPPSIDVLNVDITASIDMDLELTSSLAGNTAALPFCPNPIFGSSAPAVMEAFGTLNSTDLDYCVLRTSFVPDGFPAVMYVTTEAANIPTAAGTLCLGGQRLYRSEPQLGNSTTPLDFRLEPVMGAAGMSVYAQTFYRTFQQGLRVTGAIELPLQ